MLPDRDSEPDPAVEDIRRPAENDRLPFVATFGDRVKRARIALDMTQHELSRVAGLHRTFISKVERGKSPMVSLHSIVRLALALEVDPGELVEGLGL